MIEEPARGPAADEGVRPTIDADGRNWENEATLGFSLRGASAAPECNHTMRASIIDLLVRGRRAARAGPERGAQPSVGPQGPVP